jgi:hypothetical protein
MERVLVFFLLHFKRSTGVISGKLVASYFFFFLKEKTTIYCVLIRLSAFGLLLLLR